MSTAVEFPGNCVTNTHILHDYSEIAYIVCTNAIPSDRTTDSGDPEKILERLRNAERQFRQHSILVALDSVKLELYTFYRKIDVLKDQRTIFGKIGQVCKLNSCTVSARQPAKITDLLKPELSRIYDLFTSAILSSLQILPKNGERAIPIGSRIYIISDVGNPQSQPASIDAFRTEWHLYRLNIQLIPTGHIVLTVQNASSGALNLVSEVRDGRHPRRPPMSSVLYLAPTGQLARYSGGIVTTSAELSEIMKSGGDNVSSQVRFAHARVMTVSAWLRKQFNPLVVRLTDDSQWIEIEVAVFDVGRGSSSNHCSELSWKQLMWPSTLTFMFKSTVKLEKMFGEKVANTDPLKFALDWFNNSTERNGALSRAQASRDMRDDGDEDQLFSDEAHFEDHFHPHASGPPAFSVNQMVYPTPPDAAITHATPGLSSVDGVAPTPAPVLSNNQPDSESFLDQEMPDIVELQPNRVGTGFYEDDLFEEVPDDKFGASADVNEPDWDFFDARGSEGHGGMTTKDIVADQATDFQDLDLDTELDGDKAAAHGDSSPKRSEYIDENTDADQAAEFPKPSPMETDSIYTNDLTISPTTVQQYGYVGKPIAGLAKPDQLPVQTPEDGFLPQTVSPQTTRRRSSVFEAIQMYARPADHDSRYDKHGKYWFDDSRSDIAGSATVLRNVQPVRPTSSSSGTSMTSGPSESDTSSSIDERKPPLLKRTWTEYRPDSPAKQEDQVHDVDLERCRTETESLLEVIGTALGEEPFSQDVSSLPMAVSRSDSAGQKKLMIAQLLVDQVSQSFFLQERSSSQFHQRRHQQIVDVVMDHNGNKVPIGHATMAELATNPSKNTHKITRLESQLLCVNRTDAEITARQSILPFWDTLGLQPYHRAKDITAFCLYPSNNSSVAEGCLGFMSRIADTYTTCNFGNHSIGRVAGLTSDGLIGWSSGSPPGPGLQQLCRQLGTAISGFSTAANSTFVVYVVSPDEEVSSYQEICDAFTALFEAFLDISEKTKKKSEVVLQILPLGFIASPDTLVVPSQDAYLQLAFEVYNRVPISRLYDMPGACASAVVLDKRQIREPTFELSDSVASPLSRDGPCLHMAYSYSADGRWLTAAWTDEQGLKALTMSYCLRVTRGGRTHSKREVFRSLWETSHDVMGRVRGKWRLVVAHTGFKVEDVTEWQQVASSEEQERRPTTAIMLVNIDLDPDIAAETKNISFRLSQQPAVMQPPAHSGTPVSTPQAHVTSPDQVVAATPTSGSMPHGSAATPPDHNADSMHDTEASLIDPAEQSWAVVLFFGLNQVSIYHRTRAAAASGLLIKRTGCKDEGRTLQMLGINLVAALRPSAAPVTVVERESALQEIIEQYRGLVTLAVSRGCINKSLDCVPWHVATAIRGARALGAAM